MSNDERSDISDTESMDDMFMEDAAIEDITEFEAMLLHPSLTQVLYERNFEYPSRVQKEVIPVAIVGRNILCQSPPGSGKRMALVVSVVQQLISFPTARNTLILCENSDTCQQLYLLFVQVCVYIRGCTLSMMTHYNPAKKTMILFGSATEAVRLVQQHGYVPDRVVIYAEERYPLPVEELSMLFRNLVGQVMIFSSMVDKIHTEFYRRLTGMDVTEVHYE